MGWSIGEEVFRCQPFAHVVSSAFKERICDFCLVSSSPEKLFKKCSACKLTYFCTVTCQKKAWATYHRDECLYLRKVTPKIPTDTVRLIARVIFKLRQGGRMDRAQLPDGSQRYFEDLMSHQKNIVKDEHRIEAFLSFFAVLQECLGVDNLPPKSEILDIYGRILINSFNLMNDDYQSVGIGLYLAPSMIDHSCSPNATVVFDGSTLLLRTIEAVESFADIRISYTNLLAVTSERKKSLRDQYYFDCHCTKCENEESDFTKNCMNCSTCQGSIPISSGICKVCGREDSSSLLANYTKLKKEFDDHVCKNINGHPEPEEDCESFYEDMKTIFHPWDKKYLDLLEMLFEQRLAKENFRGSMSLALEILEHYYQHYPKFDINTGLMELKTAKLLAFLDSLEEAEKHLEKAKDILVVTHGPSHPLVAGALKQLKQDIDMGRRELNDLRNTSKLKISSSWAKSG